MAEADDTAPVSRRNPHYAFTPMRMLGLSAGSLMTAFVVFGLSHYLVDPYYGLTLAVVVAFVGEKFANHKEPGFAVQWVSAHATGVVCGMIAKTWRRAGAMPPPNFQRLYEP
jgi:hypothetical protein